MFAFHSVAPTFVETNLTRKRLQDPTFRRFVLGKIPKGELALPADIAAAVVYLAIWPATRRAWSTAQTLPVDGGWTAW